MDNRLRMTIKDLLSEEEITRKTITLNLDEELIDRIDKIAKAFSILNTSKNFSRNSIIENAVKTFVEEAEDLLIREGNMDIDQEIENQEPKETEFDLVTFPAHNDQFQEIFIKEKQWYSVRIKETRIPRIKYMALYRGTPESAITHYGKVKEIVQYQDTRKKMIILEGEPIELENKVNLGKTDANSMRAPRYTTLEKLLCAKEVKDLF